MNGATKYIQGDIPWCILFAEDVVLVDKMRVDVNANLELWRQTLESKGFALNRTKTEYMRCDFCGVWCKDGNFIKERQIVPNRDNFRYLGSMLQGHGDIDQDVCHMIKEWWMKLR
jgi:hypothetical protein